MRRRHRPRRVAAARALQRPAARAGATQPRLRAEARPPIVRSRPSSRPTHIAALVTFCTLSCCLFCVATGVFVPIL